MENTENQIIKNITAMLSGGNADGLKAENPFLAGQLAAVTPAQITVGECAEFIKGHFEGNLRTDGHKWSGDVKYTRTLNFDFTTGEIVFVSDKNHADYMTVNETAEKLYGLQRYSRAEAIYTETQLIGKEFFEIKDEIRALKRNLYALCKTEHQKLGFWFESLDVLQYNFIPHPDDAPRLRPVYVLLNDKKGRAYKTFIGWYSETDGKTQLDLNVLRRASVYKKTKEVTAAEKRKKTVKITLGVLCGVALAALIIVAAVVFPML